MPELQRKRSVVLVESAENSVVKCIVILPKGKQTSLISVLLHPYTIVNNSTLPENSEKFT